MRLVLALVILAISPNLAFAHADSGGTLSLLAGFGHPLGGFDHLLAMLTVGIFAAVLGGRALFLVPLSFLIMLLAGFALGLAQINLPYVELAIALSSIVIGLAATLQRPLSIAAAATLVGSFAVFHGHAHGAEMPSDADSVNFAIGFIAATALICLTGLATATLATRTARRHGVVLARSAAGVCAVLGIGLLAGWL